MWGAWPPERPLVISHRALAPGQRENTLDAVRTARQAGADAVEVDVRCTADGVPILHHDPQLGDRAVHATSLSRLQAEARRQGYELALAADVLDEATAVNLELKHPDAIDPMLDLLADRSGDPVLVSGFDPAISRQVSEQAPRVPTGLVLGRQRLLELLYSARRRRRLQRWAQAARADVLAVHRSFARLGLRGLVHGTGLPVAIWTVNRSRRLGGAMRHPRTWAVITDRPTVAHHARARTHPARTRIEEPSNGSQQPG